MEFKLPEPFGADIPMKDLHVYQWASQQEVRSEVTLHNYLQAVGFQKGVHRLREKDVTVLRYALEAWHRTAPLLKGEYSLDELLPPGGPYYLQAAPWRCGCSQKVKEALVQAGWVHPVRSSTTYFAVVDGVLWAHYQTILGQRAIARIKE